MTNAIGWCTAFPAMGDTGFNGYAIPSIDTVALVATLTVME